MRPPCAPVFPRAGRLAARPRFFFFFFCACGRLLHDQGLFHVWVFFFPRCCRPLFFSTSPAGRLVSPSRVTATLCSLLPLPPLQGVSLRGHALPPRCVIAPSLRGASLRGHAYAALCSRFLPCGTLAARPRFLFFFFCACERFAERPGFVPVVSPFPSA